MNDQSEAPRPHLWARQGETVACIDGHPICDVAHDLYVTDPHRAAHFTNWRQPEPDHAAHVMTLRCACCRGVWVRLGSNGVIQLHFAEGWR